MNATNFSVKRFAVVMLFVVLCIALAYERNQANEHKQKYEEISYKYEEIFDDIQHQNQNFIKSINQELDSIVYALKENNKILLYEAASRLLTITDICTIDEIEEECHLAYYNRIATIFLEFPVEEFDLCFDSELRQRFSERIDKCAPVESNIEETYLLELLNHLYQVVSNYRYSVS